MEKILQKFESRFCDYTSLEAVKNQKPHSDEKIDYKNSYVDDCGITAHYVYDLFAVPNNNLYDKAEGEADESVITRSIDSLNDDIVIYFEYYMIDSEMHSLCYIELLYASILAVRRINRKSYSGITCACHEWCRRQIRKNL
jgi:hypothetical protein